MGLFGKKKKEEDFSFDMPPASDQSPSNVQDFLQEKGHVDPLTGLPPLGAEQQQTSADSSLPPDPFTKDTPHPQHIPPTPGQQLAHDYVGEQNPTPGIPPQQPAPTQQKPSDPLELINIKLDAIRSELSAISQRLQRLENDMHKDPKQKIW